MDLSLNTLVEQLDELASERETRAWRVASGVEPRLPPVPELPELTRLDAWQYVGEVLESPRLDEAKRGRLVLLRRHLARAFVEARGAEAREARDAFLRDHSFFAGGRTWTPLEAARELPRLASREARDAVEGELSRQHAAGAGHAQRWLDAAQEATGALRLTPASLVEVLHGRPAGPRLEQAGALLAATGDAAADLLAYALKRVEPQLSSRVAKRHDARRAGAAPWLSELLRREDLEHAVTRTLGDLGLNPAADGRITVDTEARPGRSPEAACFELRVPDQVRLLLTPDAGHEAFAGWLGAWGVALHRAHVGRALPYVERRLGDRAVVRAVGLLFEGFLVEEGWLKRYLRLTSAQAREVARLVAFRQLQAQRELAAHARFSAEALAQGRSTTLRDAYVEALSAAWGVEVPDGEAPFVVDAFGGGLLELDAWALATAMRASLLERFNEDYYRNPATGRWLVELAGRGQRDDATAVAKALGAAALDPIEAARRCVQVMGA